MANKPKRVTMEDPGHRREAPAAAAVVVKTAASSTAPKTDEGVDCTQQPPTAPPAPPIEVEGGGEGKPSPSKENPFDQYYSQLTHQQNMLQDSVRVTAYQRAILENVADFKVRVNQGGRGNMCQSVPAGVIESLACHAVCGAPNFVVAGSRCP